MARLQRVSPEGHAVHVMIKSNNRVTCFKSPVDYSAYMWWLREYSEKNGVEIHAWSLLKNHINLLCTPNIKGGLSRMIQSIGRQYVRFFNKRNKRTGTLWEGRFRSCLIQSDISILELYKYIELNPIRLNFVREAGDYKWSSYLINAEGNSSALCFPHKQYLNLGNSKKERQLNYRKFCEKKLNTNIVDLILKNTNRGLAIGDDNFKIEVENITGLRVRSLKKGRPTGWRKQTYH